MSYPRPPAQRDSWFAPLSVDLVAKVLRVTFLHPFVAWMVPLCFRAEAMDWSARPMIVSLVYATLVTIAWMLGIISSRVAYGLPREVDLEDEVIVVTGGASGLGLLIAEVYGMRGATVAVLDVRDEMEAEARGVTYYKCDVGDKEQVARVAAEIERDLGTPTILINNAAIVVGKPLLDMSLSEIDSSISTNLLSHFYTLKAFLPGMMASELGGTIVTVSSVIGHVGAARLTDYAAAKAGITALHKSLVAELAASPAADRMRAILVTAGQLSTPLFHGVRTPNALIAPVVEPVDVAHEIISMVDAGKSGHITLPLYAGWIDWYNVLPAGLQRIARALAGVDTAMNDFVGRAGLAAQAKAAEKSGEK